MIKTDGNMFIRRLFSFVAESLKFLERVIEAWLNYSKFGLLISQIKRACFPIFVFSYILILCSWWIVMNVVDALTAAFPGASAVPYD